MDHSTRLIMIPEELYQSLISQRDSAQAGPLGSHLTSTLSQMDKILHTPGLNDEQKYALYNSQFKKFKNLKDENVERQPSSNVKLKSISDDISNAIIKALTQYQKPNRFSSVSSYASAFDSEKSHETDKEIDSDEETIKSSPTKSPEKNTTKKDTPIKEPLNNSSEKTPRPKRNASVSEKAKIYENKADEILKEMLKNKQLFGINDKNQIFDAKNSPINNSNAKMAILRMLNQPESTSPPGMRTLRARISRAPNAQQLFNKAREEINLELNQKGEGKNIK